MSCMHALNTLHCVCFTLGAVAVRGIFFGRPAYRSVQFIISQVLCNGSETELVDCLTNPLNESDICYSRVGAGVICPCESKHIDTDTR